MFRIFKSKSPIELKLNNIGISLKEYNHLKTINKSVITETKIFDKPILISHPFWYTHSLDELFIEEVYKFKTSIKTPLVIDCGANWGLSILYFKKLYPQSRIIAYEADPNIYKLLSNNLKQFAFENIEIYNTAIWNEETDLPFSVDGALGGTISTLGINTENQVNIKSIKLSSILKEEKRVDFLKIDIEGAEYEVLKECYESLSNVDRIFVEYHSNPSNEQKLDEILFFLRKSGFRVYIKEAWENMKHPFDKNGNLYYDLQLNIFGYRDKPLNNLLSYK
ncbi:FkbM family methyltransferase [Pontibacter vulgaris]|uniref:FkbM family methyltransferase n=1 Tax=Pontibacter vulgaris TaxID=2905679 RepID=UPI001FA74FAA|nr:FkbM family methyltransferase [Pontibacter vulgaris]